MIDKVIKKNECCGCYACFNVCPAKCIEMKKDEEGFVYPKVDYDKCIHCEMCVKVCPALGERKYEKTALKDPEVYASYTKDNEIRLDSTSGGIFTEVAKTFIKNNGIVYGAIYDENHKIVHYRGETNEDIDKIRQSKYAQSDIGGNYINAKKDLIAGKKVLFVGTPCHIAALKRFLIKDYDNLYTMDFLCRGVNSPEAYKNYLESMKKKYNSNIKKVIFKNKTHGWHRFSTKLIFENGKEYVQDRYHDSYMRGYLEGCMFMRPSCHECKYKDLPRYADVTVGDFWGIEKVRPELDQDKGTSIYMINTPKGFEMFEEIKENLIFSKMKLEDIYLGNKALTVITTLTNKQKKMREKFFERYQKENFVDLVEEILKPTLYEKVLRKAKDIIKKIIGRK